MDNSVKYRQNYTLLYNIIHIMEQGVLLAEF